MYVIKILNSKDDCWIAPWEGDPPRTLIFVNAQVFATKTDAKNRIKEVKNTHPFKVMTYDIRKASNF